MYVTKLLQLSLELLFTFKIPILQGLKKLCPGQGISNVYWWNLTRPIELTVIALHGVLESSSWCCR